MYYVFRQIDFIKNRFKVFSKIIKTAKVVPCLLSNNQRLNIIFNIDVMYITLVSPNDKRSLKPLET